MDPVNLASGGEIKIKNSTLDNNEEQMKNNFVKPNYLKYAHLKSNI